MKRIRRILVGMLLIIVCAGGFVAGKGYRMYQEALEEKSLVQIRKETVEDEISYRQSSSRIFTRKQLCQWKINGFTDIKELILLELRGHSITISVRESFWREEARLLNRWQKISILTWIKQLSGRLPRYLWQLRWKKNLQKRRF